MKISLDCPFKPLVHHEMDFKTASGQILRIGLQNWVALILIIIYLIEFTAVFKILPMLLLWDLGNTLVIYLNFLNPNQQEFSFRTPAVFRRIRRFHRSAKNILYLFLGPVKQHINIVYKQQQLNCRCKALFHKKASTVSGETVSSVAKS